MINPRYSITSPIVELIVSISEKLGQVNAAHLTLPATASRDLKDAVDKKY